jgi:transposase
MSTSQKYPECVHTDKGNRPTQAQFRRLAGGYKNKAYLVGTLNIFTAG